MNRRNTLLLFGILVLVAVIAVVATADMGDEANEHGTRAATDNSYMDTATYMGADTCAGCHSDKYNEWKDSLHNKKVRPATSENVTGDFSQNPVIGDLGTIDLDYNTTTGNYTATVGSTTYTIKWALGSGTWKQRYMVEVGNSTYILPIQYNTATQEWVPYHDNHWNATTGEPTSFDNAWEKNCMGCHSTGYEVSQNVNDEWVGTYTDLNIACEACHGPGSKHVPTSMGGESTTGPDTDYIWRSPEAMVCARCHIRGESLDGNHGYPNGMKPGDNFLDYYTLTNSSGKLWSDNSSKGHHQQWMDWNLSAHSRSLLAAGGSVATNPDCQKCHVAQVAIEETFKGETWGDDETEYTITSDNAEPISCAVCHESHGQGIEHQLRAAEDELCNKCHTYGDASPGDTEVHNPQSELVTGTAGVGVDGEPWMEGKVNCVDCHMPKTAKSAVPYDISSHTFEVVTPADTIRIGKPNACQECHSLLTNDDMDDIIEDWEADYDTTLLQTEAKFTTLDELKAGAELNGTWTTVMNDTYNNALFNFLVAEAEGHGVHNNEFLLELLENAGDAADTLIAQLGTGTLTGTVTDADSDPIAGATVSVGNSAVVTDSAGSYTITDLTPGSPSVTVFKLGVISNTTAVTIYGGGTTTQDFTLADDFDNDGTPDSTDTDDDNDGLPDTWETDNGLDPKDSTDADDDDDGDGMTNLQEYADGKDPQVADKEEVTEADTMPYLALIIILILVIVIMGILLAKKGGKSSVIPEETEAPPEEPPAEETPEEEIPEEEE